MDATSRPTQPLFLHFPKAGTSFVTTIEIHGGSTRGVWTHDPVSVNATHEELRAVAAMFRHPEERLLSMYWWIRQANGHCCTVQDFGWPGGREWNQVAEQLVSGASPMVVAPYTRCQVHMVMGYRCCSRHEYHGQSLDEVLRAAKKRVDRFFFVGLTSEWRLSLCLFNYKMTGRRYVTLQQMKNCRKTTINASNAIGHHESLGNHSMLPRDEAEHELFDHVSARFWRELRAFDITDASCPLVSNRTWGCRLQTVPKIHAQEMHALSEAYLFPTTTRENAGTA